MQKHGNEKSPCQTVHKYTVFFELLLTYQELLYFNFCLDFHMVCIYFKKFQSASSIKSSNLSPDCVWQFIFRCFYSGFLCKYQDNKKGKQSHSFHMTGRVCLLSLFSDFINIPSGLGQSAAQF